MISSYNRRKDKGGVKIIIALVTLQCASSIKLKSNLHHQSLSSEGFQQLRNTLEGFGAVEARKGSKNVNAGHVDMGEAMKEIRANAYESFRNSYKDLQAVMDLTKH